MAAAGPQRPRLLGTVFALSLAAAVAAVPAAALDPRSTEVLLSRCESEIGRRDITLFGNGTVRLRQGSWEDQALFLDELDPPAMAAALERIEGAFDDRDQSFERLPRAALEGPWVERCEVRVELADRDRYVYRYSRFDVPPLEVARLVQLAEDLGRLARPLDAPQSLPRGYGPAPGDVLIDRQGHRYVVIRLTSDGRGVEVEARHEPVRSFHALEALRQVFVDVEPRKRP